jgi:hypothetical protein
MYDLPFYYINLNLIFKNNLQSLDDRIDEGTKKNNQSGKL